MKRIFLDTNVLIDYIDDRAGADDAEQIFACGFSGEAFLYKGGARLPHLEGFRPVK